MPGDRAEPPHREAVRRGATAGFTLPVPLRAWHWLLTPGWSIRHTAAARLRGWARVLRWRRTTGRRRGYLVKAALWAPIRAWKVAGEEVRRFGAEVREVSGVAPAAQRRQLWWLAMRHGLTAESYVDQGLYLPERRRRAADYMEQGEHSRVVWWLLRQRDAGPDDFPGRDKTRFPEWCARHGIPTIPVLLELEAGAVVRSSLGGPPAAAGASGASVAALLPPHDLFAKPSDGQYGAGNLLWRYDPEARGWVGGDGRVRDAVALVEALAAHSATLRQRFAWLPNRLLVQPRVRNHAALRPLAPRALCTVRVLTCRMPGEPGRIVFAAFRMAVGDAPADNFHFGGIIAPVDLETGRLGPALRRRDFVLAPIDRHPDTGAPIAGHALPWWAEAKALALRAFAAAPERATVGWDVAITDDGPFLVEGNTASHPDIAQATMRRPLGDTGYPAVLEAHVRRVFASGRLRRGNAAVRGAATRQRT